MEVSTLIINGRDVVFVKEKGINGKVAIRVVEEAFSAMEYAMDVSQNMSYAYIVRELVKKTNIDTVMIISRRDFFRKVAKILPILMLSASSLSPVFSSPIADCNNSCKGSCKSSCNNNCINTHKGGCSACSSQCKMGCEGSCRSTCRNTGKCDECSDSCKGSCKGTCSSSCQSSAKGKDTIRFKW